MSIVKKRLVDKTGNVLHLETSSDLVLRPDGTTVEDKLSSLVMPTLDSLGGATKDHTHDEYALLNHTHTLSALGAAAESHSHSQYLTSHQSLSGYVPTTRTVNGKKLSSNISLTASDVGAAATSHSHSEYDFTCTYAYKTPTITPTDTRINNGTVTTSGPSSPIVHIYQYPAFDILHIQASSINMTKIPTLNKNSGIYYNFKYTSPITVSYKYAVPLHATASMASVGVHIETYNVNNQSDRNTLGVQIWGSISETPDNAYFGFHAIVLAMK